MLLANSFSWCKCQTKAACSCSSFPAKSWTARQCWHWDRAADRGNAPIFKSQDSQSASANATSGSESMDFECNWVKADLKKKKQTSWICGQTHECSSALIYHKNTSKKKRIWTHIRIHCMKKNCCLYIIIPFWHWQSIFIYQLHVIFYDIEYFHFYFQHKCNYLIPTN